MNLYGTFIRESAFDVRVQSEPKQQQHASEGDLGRDTALCLFRCAQMLADCRSGHLFDLQIGERGSLLRQVRAHDTVNISCRRNEDRETGQDEGGSKRSEDHWGYWYSRHYYSIFRTFQPLPSGVLPRSAIPFPRSFFLSGLIV